MQRILYCARAHGVDRDEEILHDASPTAHAAGRQLVLPPGANQCQGDTQGSGLPLISPDSGPGEGLSLGVTEHSEEPILQKGKLRVNMCPKGTQGEGEVLRACKDVR